jgi:hypothetical protein
MESQEEMPAWFWFILFVLPTLVLFLTVFNV